MQLSTSPVAILEESISFEKYVPINLSKDNPDLYGLDIAKPDVCQAYISKVLKRNAGKVAYGGYLEVRNLYNDKGSFSNSHKIQRNIHLGIDYWCSAGTAVITPLDGTVHSFRNNAVTGDYGPTIILQHIVDGFIFYSLYGHLSIDSLKGLYVGKHFAKGETLARLGTPDINVNYAPHLHFQLIMDIQEYSGDYPGVCAVENMDFYKQNCPDPNLLLKIG